MKLRALAPSRSSARPTLWALAALAALPLATGCGEQSPGAERERRGPPPPVASSAAASAAAACTRQRVDDDATKDIFEAKIGGQCLDPADGGKAMGEGAKQTLEHIADVFDGEAAVYEAHGIVRLSEARYVAESGPASVQVVLSKFKTSEGAYAMFTKRIVGDGDPADEATPKPTESAGVAALGIGNAYLWKGPWLAEIVYANDTATPEAVAKEGRTVLPAFIRSLGAKLAGDATPPADVALLPGKDRLPLGVRLVMGGDTVWPTGAVGYYAAEGRRYRVYARSLASEDEARKALAALTKGEGNAAVAGVGDEAFKTRRKDGAVTVELVGARRGTRVFAIADEPRAMPAGLSDEKRAALTLAGGDKEKLLGTLVSSAAP